MADPCLTSLTPPIPIDHQHFLFSLIHHHCLVFDQMINQHLGYNTADYRQEIALLNVLLIHPNSSNPNLIQIPPDRKLVYSEGKDVLLFYMRDFMYLFAEPSSLPSEMTQSRHI